MSKRLGKPSERRLGRAMAKRWADYELGTRIASVTLRVGTLLEPPARRRTIKRAVATLYPAEPLGTRIASVTD